MITLQDIQNQWASFFGGGGQTAGQFGGDVSPTGMTYPTPQNTSMDWTPNAGDTGSGFGLNLGTAGAALGGLQALGSLLQGNKALKLGQDQLKFQKEVTNTNLNNSIKSYNTSLEDRLTARGRVQGDDPAATQARIERDRLTR